MLSPSKNRGVSPAKVFALKQSPVDRLIASDKLRHFQQMLQQKILLHKCVLHKIGLETFVSTPSFFRLSFLTSSALSSRDSSQIRVQLLQQMLHYLHPLDSF